MQGRAAAPSRGAGLAHRLPQGTAAAAVPPGAAGVDPAAGHTAGGTPWSVLCNKTKTYCTSSIDHLQLLLRLYH